MIIILDIAILTLMLLWLGSFAWEKWGKRTN